MNLAAAAPPWLQALFVMLLIAVAIEDSVRLRISNLTCLGILAGAIAAAVLAGPDWSLWQNLALFAAVLMLGTIAFGAGKLGGGDVKLFAVCSLWFGLSEAPRFVAAVFLAGGLLALIVLALRRLRRARKDADSRRQCSPSLPYGVAIAAGTAFTLWSTV